MLKKSRPTVFKRVSAKVIYLIPLFLIGTLVYVFARSSFWGIDSISCKTQYGPCSDKDLKQLTKFTHQNLFFLNTGDVMQLLSQDYTNRQMFVEKVFPKALVVVLEKRKPLVGITLEGKEGTFLADLDGMVTEYSTQTNLPVIIVNGSSGVIVVGREISPELKQAIGVMYLTHKAQNAKLGIFNQESLTVDLPDSKTAIYPLDRDPEVLVGALQLILIRSRIENKTPRVIDLRYSNPVLRY